MKYHGKPPFFCGIYYAMLLSKSIGFKTIVLIINPTNRIVNGNIIKGGCYAMTNASAKSWICGWENEKWNRRRNGLVSLLVKNMVSRKELDSLPILCYNIARGAYDTAPICGQRQQGNLSAFYGVKSQQRYWRCLFPVGQIRQYNITKKEWILKGNTVTYASWNSIKEIFEYDFTTEKQFSYVRLSVKVIPEQRQFSWLSRGISSIRVDL